MPTFLLCIRAELENIERIEIPEDAEFVLTLKNPSSDDTREGVVVSPLEEVELSNSRGTANLALKWAKDARGEASLTVKRLKGVTRPYEAEDGPAYVPVAAFECRGLEPVGWEPREAFTLVAPSGTRWEDADLSAGEWSEYDEKADEAVSVMNLEWKFQVHREK